MVMSVRMQKVAIVVLSGAVLVMAGLVLYNFVTPRSETETPRTAAERQILDARLAVKQAPGSLKGRLELAAALAAAGNYRAALDQTERALVINPKAAEGARIKGAIYAKMGETGQAVVWLKKAAASRNQMAEFYAGVYAELGKVYEDSGRAGLAIKAYRDALRYLPMTADIYKDLGRLYEQAGRLEDARRAFNSAYSFDTEDLSSLEAVKRLDRQLRQNQKSGGR